MSKITIERAEIVLMSKDAIKSDQDGIRKDILSMDKRIHANAVQCLLHASVHGDTSLMTRLLVDIVDAKTGYRRQGLINWVRKFSPMELKGSVINLSGLMTEGGIKSLVKQFPEIDRSLLVAGARRPFLVNEANATPFWTDSDNAEMVAKPVYRDNLMAKFDSAFKEFNSAIENTVNGKPIDPSKPFYDGIHADKVIDFFTKANELRSQLPPDDTRKVRLARQEAARLNQVAEEAEKAMQGEIAPVKVAVA
ncbi:unnamed protein product [Sphagnum jensenii]